MPNIYYFSFNLDGYFLESTSVVVTILAAGFIIILLFSFKFFFIFLFFFLERSGNLGWWFLLAGAWAGTRGGQPCHWGKGKATISGGSNRMSC